MWAFILELAWDVEVFSWGQKPNFFCSNEKRIAWSWKKFPGTQFFFCHQFVLRIRQFCHRMELGMSQFWSLDWDSNSCPCYAITLVLRPVCQGCLDCCRCVLLNVIVRVSWSAKRPVWKWRSQNGAYVLICCQKNFLFVVRNFRPGLLQGICL